VALVACTQPQRASVEPRHGTWVVVAGDPADPRWRGLLIEPTGVGRDADGNLYVSGGLTGDVEKISPDGTLVARWGGFESPAGVAVDDEQNVYVLDQPRSQLHKLSSAGQELAVWGGFAFPYGVAVDGAGNVYVADTRADRVRKLSPAGQPLA